MHATICANTKWEGVVEDVFRPIIKIKAKLLRRKVDSIVCENICEL